jgi:hypothetical protein
MNHKQTAIQVGCWLAVLCLGAVGCGTGNKPSTTQQASPPRTTAGQSVEGASGKQPTNSRQPIEDALGKHQFPHKTDAVNRPLEAPLPRQAAYNALRVNLTKGTITDVAPPGQKRRAGADHVYAYLDVSIHNSRESTTLFGLSPALFKLQLGEDEFGSPLTEDWSLELKPRATEKVTLVYAVPKDMTWERAALVISQAKEEPETLALHGPVPAPRSPTALALPAQKEIQSGDFVCKLASASLDVEHEQRRVAKGKRFLKLTGSLVYQGKNVSINFFGDRQLHLLVAGQPAEAVSNPIESLVPKAPKTFEAVYLIPAGTKAVDFRLGDKEDAASKVALDLAAIEP